MTSSGRVAVLVLGPPVIQTSGAMVRPSRRMARILLGMFALRPNRPISIDWIIDGLWPSYPPASAAANVRSHIAEFRRLLGTGNPALETVDDGYLLAAQPGEVDALWFQHLLREGRRNRSIGAEAAAARCLTEALGLWRGEVLAGMAVPMAVQPQAVALEEERISAMEELADIRLALGHQHDLVPELKALVLVHPLRERLWYQLLLALAALGRRSEVVETYRQLAQVLDAELGVRPSQVATELHDMVRGGG